MTLAAVQPGARELLQLERVGENRFRAVHNLDNGMGAIFGGQPLLQGLAAARRTVGGWPAHSLTGYFLRAGAPATPLDYQVEAVRDGRSFAARRVLASQDGRPVFDMLCSFHAQEPGPAHQSGEPPASPPPGGLPSVRSFVAANAGRLPRATVEGHGRPFPIELRLIEPEWYFFEKAETATRTYWVRMPSAAGIDDPLDQQCLLAFVSDYWFAGTAGALHVAPGDVLRINVVTLNHSLWFHAPVRADAWLMYHTESPWAGQGRGVVRGSIYDEAGTLVATAVQEISIRKR